MKKLLLALLLFVVDATAQVTTGKPADIAYDTGETHFPTHCWPMDEGTGTSLNDGCAEAASSTQWDLAFVGTTGDGPDWSTDATQGDIIQFVISNEDYVHNGAVSVSGTRTACVVVDLIADGVVRDLIGYVDSSQTDRFNSIYLAGDEQVDARARFDDTSDVNGSAFNASASGTYDLVCLRASDTIVDISFNGAAWDTLSVTKTGLMAAVDDFALGGSVSPTPSRFFDSDMTFGFEYDSSKSDAEISTIYNSGDPWPIIGIDAASNVALLRRRR